jgi:hypothetical protein
MSKKKTKTQNTAAHKAVKAILLTAVGLAVAAGVALLVIVGMLIATLVGNHNSANSANGSSKPTVSVSTNSGTADLNLTVAEGVTIESIAKYTGIYMEDGTDEVVSGVMMLILNNDSDKDLQYAEITLTYEDGTKAEFTVTNLPDGQKVVLLEKNRLQYRTDKPKTAEAKNTVFVDAFTMHIDTIQISGLQGMLNVKNISGKDISGDIYVYYKNSATDLLYGGITYRSKVSGGLKAGEIRQITAGHYNPKSSSIVMVTIAG